MSKSDIKAFNMYGNLYFVGSTRVSVHIIKTEEGLVMIDTGYPDMYEQIADSMNELGLDPKDICAIFHSHGHIDHYGCTREFVEISGAKIYISRIDNEIVNGTYDLSWAKELNWERIEPFDCDVLIEDGDIFTFGSTTVRCVHTPGHTDGVMSYFVNVQDGDKELIAGMFGGMGMNTMRAEYLDKNGFSYDCRDKFKESISKLRNEQVDIVMGNHPENNNTVGKSQGEMSCVDAQEWQRLLDDGERSLANTIAKEAQTL